jgi:hypothetical protein
VLRSSVLLDKLGEFVDESVAEGDHPFKISGGEHDREIIRDQNAIPCNDRRLGIKLTAESTRDFDRLKTTLEGLGEGTVHGSLKTTLEAV